MAPRNLSNNKILVVDEDPEPVLLLKGHLESAGFEVVSAPDGKTALTAAQQKEPDLVLLGRSGDVSKRKRFGVQLILRLIRRLERRGYKIHSSFVPEYSAPPLTWKGPLPDLLAERRGKRVAISLEEEETLQTPMTSDRWKAFLGNVGVNLIVVVDSGISKRVAKILRKAHGLQCKIILEKERRKLDKFFHSKISFRRYFPARWLSLSGLCIFFALICSMAVKVFPKIFDAVAQGLIINLAFYQPKDDERLLNDVEDIPEKWKKQLKDSLSKFAK